MWSNDIMDQKENYLHQNRVEEGLVFPELPYQKIRAIAQEFGNLLKIQDNYPKLVVTQDDFSRNSYQIT